MRVNRKLKNKTKRFAELKIGDCFTSCISETSCFIKIQEVDKGDKILKGNTIDLSTGELCFMYENAIVDYKPNAKISIN